MRLEFNRWRVLDAPILCAWKSHASIMNDSPVPGRFYQIPRQVSRDLLNNVLQYLTLNWEDMVKVFKTTITCPPKRSISL